MKLLFMRTEQKSQRIQMCHVNTLQQMVRDSGAKDDRIPGKEGIMAMLI